jgi:hypothetical protein
MKFVKENLTLVIVGAVILLAIVSIFYPTGSLKASLQRTMEERMSVSQSVQKLQNQEIKIPGVEGEYKGIPSEKMVKAKEQALEYMKEQSKKVVEVGAAQNKVGRVNNEGLPMFMGQPQKGFLPKIEGVSPMAFKDSYSTVFPFWTLQLTGTDKLSATPPSNTDLQAQWEEKRRQQEANRPVGAAPAVEDPRQRVQWEKQQVMNRASTLHMYVDASAFQQRGWAAGDAAPNEQNIFESLVDSWLQGDVVRAIAETNKEAFAKAGERGKNVGTAAVKRLMRITVGNEAQGSRMGGFDSIQNATGGSNIVGSPGATPATTLFYVAAPQVPGADQTQAANAAAMPNEIHFSRTMTGRASGTEYDVVLMQINVDVDPSWLNRLIDQLYRQNMGYTVLNIRWKTVDPLTRSSMGFVYGETQVIEAEIVVEALMFRDWTRPLMPEKIRVSLGLPAEEPAAAPAQ